MLHSTTPINSYGKKFNEKAEKDEKSTKKFRYFFFHFFGGHPFKYDWAQCCCNSATK